MSFDKAIQHGKEHRQPYRGSKAFDSTCRNHGSCDFCMSNRTHSIKKEQQKAEYSLLEYQKPTDYRAERS